MTDRYAVIGNPIEQSRSPFIHGAFALATGQDMSYVKLLGPLGGFAPTVDAFRAAGGRGLNVTTPFKLDAYAYATDRSEDAQWAGAANALKFEGARVWAENFDGVGLVRDVVVNLGFPMAGRRVLVLGAGGAVRGALLPLLAQGPAQLTIVNRTADKAQALAAMAASRAGPGTRVAGLAYDGLQGQAFDIVFNATSASMRAEMPPIASSVFAPGALAYDLAYGKGLTPFLRLATGSPVAHVADGVGMLAEQAAEAFAWWRGVRPSTAQVIRELTVPLV
jgi:shikimate dehydrogenase